MIIEIHLYFREVPTSGNSVTGGVHIGARALLGIKLIWFGYIARLSQWGGGGG